MILIGPSVMYQTFDHSTMLGARCPHTWVLRNYCVVAQCVVLQAPLNDDRAATLLIGMSMSTTKAHIVRAMLESLAFRFALLYETILKETKSQFSSSIKYCIVWSCTAALLMLT